MTPTGDFYVFLRCKNCGYSNVRHPDNFAGGCVMCGAFHLVREPEYKHR